MNDINPTNITPSISSRLVIKNIPENFPDNHLTELIKKNFENKIKDINILKLEHKYSKNNKLCFFTTDNLNTRREIMQFFNGFEVIDPKGFKQKLSIIDCLFQNKSASQVDKIENTIEQKFFTNSKLVDFKNEEPKFHEGIFLGVEEIELAKTEKELESNKIRKAKEEKEKQSKDNKPGKKIITKKPPSVTPIHPTKIESSINTAIPATNPTELSTKNQFPSVLDRSDIEIITTKADDGYYNSSRGKKDNYKGNKKQVKDNYYNYGEKSSNYYNQSTYNAGKTGANKNYDNYYENGSGGGDYYNNAYDNEYKTGDGNNYGNNDYNYKTSYKKSGYK